MLVYNVFCPHYVNIIIIDVEHRKFPYIALPLSGKILLHCKSTVRKISIHCDHRVWNFCLHCERVARKIPPHCFSVVQRIFQPDMLARLSDIREKLSGGNHE